MEGHRGYVADGWKIVTHVDPGERWDETDWELYDLTADFAEHDDLAAVHPEKVTALEAKWWAAAARYQVLPIDDRSPRERGRTAFPRMRNFGRKRFAYEIGTNTIDRIQAPQLTHRSFTVTARIAPHKRGEAGVLAAMGDRSSGYAFFVQDERLHWLVNLAGEEVLLSSSGPIREQASTLAFEFARGEDGASGIGRLRIDGDVVAEGALASPVPRMTWEGLDIGRDQRLPVTPRYQAPFAFEGDLREVAFEIE